MVEGQFYGAYVKPSVTCLRVKSAIQINVDLITLGPEGLATEMTLIGLLSCVDPDVHVQVGLLSERMAAKPTNKRPLVPVR